MSHAETIADRIAEHHEIAAAHYDSAAEHHRRAAEQIKIDEPEVAAHYAHAAHGHHVQATYHADEASKLHAEHHGSVDLEPRSFRD